MGISAILVGCDVVSGYNWIDEDKEEEEGEEANPEKREGTGVFMLHRAPEPERSTSTSRLEVMPQSAQLSTFQLHPASLMGAA